jgi:hypothetical protein
MSKKRKRPKGLTREEFAGLRLAALDEAYRQQKRSGKTVAPVRIHSATERARPARTPVAESVEPPNGVLPKPDGDQGVHPWEMSPQELRAAMDLELWPTDDSNHRWVPRAPMSLSDFLKSGI